MPSIKHKVTVIVLYICIYAMYNINKGLADSQIQEAHISEIYNVSITLMGIHDQMADS